ncbi:DUF948 domain-containing protein [Rubeoparvulum massiliense]|uniref:DUF948 domain-containing protein n=1 Tax=Rubeoparvulum massiliense TaxID=1631346 RepID=UPI00065E0872|nr:DUF948 domain-containing protein [Rubeoparvulum massiliense]
MWAELSLVVIAIAFVFLVYYVIQTLKTAQATLNQWNETLPRIEQKVDQLVQETTNTLQEANQVILQAQEQSKSVTEMLNKVNTKLDSVSASFKAKRQALPIDAALQATSKSNLLIPVAQMLAKVWRERRQKKRIAQRINEATKEEIKHE